ncbi:MAG: hypothetical protein V2A53_00290 [bacterium]
MNAMIAEEILEEGVETLYENLGPIKAIKFFQMIGLNKGNSVAELEQKTEAMSRKEVIELIKKVRQEKKGIWEKIGLI